MDQEGSPHDQVDAENESAEIAPATRPHPNGDREQDLREAYLWAMERAFRDAHDSAMYTGDYITKTNPIIGDVLGEQAVGVERFHRSRANRSRLAGECRIRADSTVPYVPYND